MLSFASYKERSRYGIHSRVSQVVQRIEKYSHPLVQFRVDIWEHSRPGLPILVVEAWRGNERVWCKGIALEAIRQTSDLAELVEWELKYILRGWALSGLCGEKG